MTKYWYYHFACYDKIPLKDRLLPVSHDYPNNTQPQICHVCGGKLTSVSYSTLVGGVRDPVLRKCHICGFEARTVKDLEKFRKISNHYMRTSAHLYGVDPVCKKCHRERDRCVQKKIRIKNPEKLRQRVKEFQQKNPEKVAAIAFAHKYLKPKSACENCGSMENLNMHHPDYTRPEYVITLCAACHHKYHAGTLILSICEEKSEKP